MQSTAVSGKVSYKFNDMELSHTARVAVVPVFAGTTVNGFLSEHTSGTYPGHDVMPVPLVPAEELITELWRTLVPAHLWRQNKRLSFELALLGGHMRLVETFVEKMLELRGISDFDDTWDALVAAARACSWDRTDVVHAAVDAVGSAFAAKYGTWLDQSRPQLVAAVVLGVPLPAGRKTTLDGDTVDSIVQNSPVAVSKCADGRVRLSFSTLTLLQLCLRSRGPLEVAVSALYQGLIACSFRVGFETFEQLCAARLAVQMMAAEYIEQKLCLEDLFPGACFSKGCPELRFDGDERSSAEHPVEKVPVLEAKEQFPLSAIVDKRTGDAVTWNRPVVVINAASAPFADLAARLASGVTLLCQIKRYYKSGFEVDGEKESVVSEVEKIQEALSDSDWLCEDDDVAVLYMSLGYGAGGKRLSEKGRVGVLDEDLSSASLPLPTAVVCRGGGFQEVFGVLADSVALKADEYVPGCVQAVPGCSRALINRAAALCTHLYVWVGLQPCAHGSYPTVCMHRTTCGVPGASRKAHVPRSFLLHLAILCCDCLACVCIVMCWLVPWTASCCT